MISQIGTLLWEMRTTAGWTLGRLAQESGVSKTALSRWESGLRQPRIPELEAVLKILNASAAQRAAVFGCIKAPRAVQHLRQIAAQAGLSELPTCGDLICALRHRKGATQEQVAQAMGVTQTTIARWEAEDRLPDSLQIQRLCYVLDASEEEVVVLTAGQFSEPKDFEPQSWEAAEQEIREALGNANYRIYRAKQFPSDLVYLSLERKTLRWAMQYKAARPLLGLIYGWHATALRNEGRRAEVRTVALKALEYSAPTDTEAWSRAVVLSATGAVYSSNRLTPERGIHQLRRSMEGDLSLDFRAWMLSDLATYTDMMGQTEQSLYFSQQAYILAERSASTMELFLRRCDYAMALLKAERYGEALSVLPTPVEGHQRENAEAYLLWSEAYCQSGNLSGAHDALQQAQNLIELYDMTWLRPRTEQYAKQF